MKQKLTLENAPTTTYYLDGKGALWEGPIVSKNNLHYCRFDGWTVKRPGCQRQKIWVLSLSERPDDFIAISQARGAAIIQSSLREAA